MVEPEHCKVEGVTAPGGLENGDDQAAGGDDGSQVAGKPMFLKFTPETGEVFTEFTLVNNWWPLRRLVAGLGGKITITAGQGTEAEGKPSARASPAG